MKRKVPNIKEWLELYDSALKFKEIKPWEWMHEDDLFGVENPETKQIAYCCITGTLGRTLGIAAYLGESGLYGYRKQLNGDIEWTFEDMHLQKCLMLTFEEKDDLDDKDIKVIKIIQQLGYELSGREAWPKFRYYEPGFFPWYLNDEQVRFLTIILNQAIDISMRMKKNPKLLTTVSKELCLIRTSYMDEDNLIWVDELQKINVKKEAIEVPVFMDELKLRAIKKGLRIKAGIWEIDCFYSPSAINDKPKPFYPQIGLIVEDNRLQVVGNSVSRKEDCLKDLRDEFLKIASQHNIIPEVIYVKKQELYELLKDIAEALRIELRLVEHLTFLEDAKTGMCDYMFNL